ncbi:MAG: tetratricopeptide repeat protein [Myxococcota bacterium]|jgi:type IV pilus assembly protein PilF|nr:tetratricopeptide repeat protein [Myxococcota bacterium]
MNRWLLLLLWLTACVGPQRKSRAVAKADLGGAYIVEGNPEAAIEVLQQAVELDRRNWIAWNKLAIAYQSRGAPEEAHKAFQQALRIAPDKAEVLNNYGLLLLSEGSIDEAIENFELARQDLVYRKPAWVLNNLGYALMLDGQHAVALGHLDEAVRRAPHLCQARFHRGLVHQELDNRDQALSDLEAVIHMCGDEAPGAYFHAGVLLQEQGDVEAAEHYLRTVIREAPGSELSREAAARLENRAP